MAIDILTHTHFDMDGVIANTEPLHVAAEIQTCRANNFAIDESKWDGFKGRTAEAIFGHLITEFGDPSIHKVADLIEQKTDIFLEFTATQLEPIEGVVDFISWMRERTKTMNLVTSSNRRVQERIVGAFGLRSFDHIVTGDDITNGKPHPEPYNRANQLAGANPEEVLVIEDSISGLESAIAAGCKTLAIATSHTPEELAVANPTFIAVDYQDARRQLAGYFAA